MKHEHAAKLRAYARAPGRPSACASMKARFRANRRHVMISVHRGHWNPLPENSLAAVRAAALYDVVEIDVHLDANGTPYLMHDDTWNRMTGHPVASVDADPELRADLTLRAGAGGPDAEPTDEPIPTLDQAFRALDGTGAIFDIDVKRPQDIEPVAETIAALGCQDLGTLKVDVASAEDVHDLVDLERRYDIMVIAKVDLCRKKDLALVVALREADVAAAEVWFNDLNLLASATAFAGDLIRFGTYTLDPVHCLGLSDARALKAPRAVWGQLADAGLGLIMTDRSEALSRYLLTR